MPDFRHTKLYYCSKNPTAGNEAHTGCRIAAGIYHIENTRPDRATGEKTGRMRALPHPQKVPVTTQ